MYYEENRKTGRRTYLQRADSGEKAKLSDSTVLLTGGAGFLGFYFIQFLTYYKEKLNIKKVICLDNFQACYPKWLKELSEARSVELHKFNVITDNIADIPGAEDADFIYHMASIASPIFYRKYPIETLDANVWGLRSLLDFYRDKKIKGLVFNPSSEIYGAPMPENVPTPEAYRATLIARDRGRAMKKPSVWGNYVLFVP